MKALFEDFSEGQVVMKYYGKVNDHLVEGLLASLESRLATLDLSKTIRKRTCYIFVELLQNLYHHVKASVDSEIDREPYIWNTNAIIKISLITNGVRIQTGNLIDKNKVSELSAIFEEIKSKDVSVLKEWYQERLANATFSEKGTAGLGFIDMARKTNNNFNFEFMKVDDKFDFFHFEINIVK
jgi:hypothetical protein